MPTHDRPAAGRPGVNLAEESRRLYEQIGTLYAAADEADNAVAVFPRFPEPGEGATAQLLADFLGTVLQVANAGRYADHTDRSLALFHAVRRYEADRTGRRS